MEAVGRETIISWNDAEPNAHTNMVTWGAN